MHLSNMCLSPYEPTFQYLDSDLNAEELAAAMKVGSIDIKDLDGEMVAYIEWSRRMHARIWRAHG